LSFTRAPCTPYVHTFQHVIPPNFTRLYYTTTHVNSPQLPTSNTTHYTLGCEVIVVTVNGSESSLKWPLCHIHIGNNTPREKGEKATLMFAIWHTTNILHKIFTLYAASKYMSYV
jgi:hypothetical protein